MGRLTPARVAILGILLSAFLAGVALYYLQVFAYYTEVTAEQAGNVTMVSVATGQSEQILFENFKAIDADSSPLRFRACFTTPLGLALLSETYLPYADAEPLVGPGWFDCFDAEAIGTALQAGQAKAFLGVADVIYGVDRVIAVLPDGRGFAWHQINACGAAVYDGEAAPAGCPPVPEGLN